MQTVLVCFGTRKNEENCGTQLELSFWSMAIWTFGEKLRVKHILVLRSCWFSVVIACLVSTFGTSFALQSLLFLASVLEMPSKKDQVCQSPPCLWSLSSEWCPPRQNLHPKRCRCRPRACSRPPILALLSEKICSVSAGDPAEFAAKQKTTAHKVPFAKMWRTWSWRSAAAAPNQSKSLKKKNDQEKLGGRKSQTHVATRMHAFHSCIC